MIMKNLKKRLLGFALTFALVAGMLPYGALAVESCTHEELKKGVCQGCSTAFSATVGETLYKTLDEAISAAATAENPAVVVLTDLKDRTLNLGKVYLVVADKSGLTFENCSFVGEHDRQVLYNVGGLLLKNVTVENTKGAFGMVSEWTEGTDLKTLTVHGGSFTGKTHGMGLKQTHLQLGVDDANQLPKFKGETADLYMEDSVVEALCDLGEASYKVDSVTPGVFAIATEYQAESEEDTNPIRKEWFRSIHTAVQFNDEERQWAQAGSIAEIVTLDAAEFTYNGEMQVPAVVATLYGRALTEADYTVAYTLNDVAVEKPIAAGKYKMTVTGKEPYSEASVQEFEIKPAALTVESATAKDRDYNGKKTVEISAVKLAGIIGDDEVSVNVTDLMGELSNKKMGTYEQVTLPAMTLTGKDAANYTLTQPTEAVQTSVTIGKKSDAALTVEVTAPEGGIVYNGSEQKPAVVVKDGEEEVEAENYTVSYENNVQAGTATVVITAVEDGLYTFEPVKGSFTIKPAALTVKSATAENKNYDGKKTVSITKVELNGVVGTDEVSVAVNSLQGELADSKAAVYNKVTLPAMTLTGANASNYTLTQPTEAVTTNVTISKGTLSAELETVKSTVGVNTTDLVIEQLGKGMPADAGTLRYTAKHQDTSDGAKVIVLNWGVDENGKLTSKLAAAAAGDRVLFDVTVSSDNYKDTVVHVEVTMGSVTVDTSKVTVSFEEDSLAYNGKEQKPAVEVKYDGTALEEDTDYTVTYPKNVTDAGKKEVTVNFKGDYSGSTTAKYTITKAKVSVSSVQAQDKTYDGTTKATVSAKLSGVISGDDVKVTASGKFADKNSGSNKSISVTYALSGDDADNYELTSTTGSTTAKITPVASSALSGKISGLTTGNADSGNKSTLQSVVTQANSALEDSGLTSTEKTNISNVKWTAEDMISRIESAAAASATESIRKSANITKDNVKVDDKALLEKAQADLNTALTNYGDNYTTAEKNDIQSKKDRITAALTVLTRVQSAQTLIEALPDRITEETKVDAALQNSLADAQAAVDLLSDYEKTLLGEDAQQKLTTIAQALEGVQPEDDAQNEVLMGTETPEEEKPFKIPVAILVLAVVTAALCGGGLFLYKRKQEENEYNW